MKKSNLLKALCAISLLTVFVVSGCKKENVKPVTINTVTATSDARDSSNYLKGTLGGEPVKFEGNAVAYNGYVNAQNGGPHDNSAYYQSGSKWITLGGTGLPVTTASIELRSLAVRVFVSPTHVSATNYFNLITPTAYPVAGDDQPSSGGFITITDKNGVVWTSNGEQQGSSFTITSRGANMLTYTVVSGTITAKMYDGQGNMKQLNGATFTAALGI